MTGILKIWDLIQEITLKKTNFKKFLFERKNKFSRNEWIGQDISVIGYSEEEKWKMREFLCSKKDA